jgi:hypothetical protein
MMTATTAQANDRDRIVRHPLPISSGMVMGLPARAGSSGRVLHHDGVRQVPVVDPEISARLLPWLPLFPTDEMKARPQKARVAEPTYPYASSYLDRYRPGFQADSRGIHAGTLRRYSTYSSP